MDLSDENKDSDDRGNEEDPAQVCYAEHASSSSCSSLVMGPPPDNN